MSRIRADQIEVAKGGHIEICPGYGEDSAGRGISRDFAEQAWHLVLEKSDNYTKYPMLDEQDCDMGYRKSPVNSEGVKGILT